MFGDLHHVAMVVESLDPTLAFIEKCFGLKPISRSNFEDQGVDLAIFKLGSSFFEVTAPSKPDSPLRAVLDRSGPGVHHIAFSVADIAEALSDLMEGGASVIDTKPTRGRSGWTVASIDARAELGTIVQLVQQTTKAESDA